MGKWETNVAQYKPITGFSLSFFPSPDRVYVWHPRCRTSLHLELTSVCRSSCLHLLIAGIRSLCGFIPNGKNGFVCLFPRQGFNCVALAVVELKSVGCLASRVLGLQACNTSVRGEGVFTRLLRKLLFFDFKLLGGSTGNWTEGLAIVKHPIDPYFY